MNDMTLADLIAAMVLQAQQDQRVQGSFYGQQGVTSMDPQARIDWERMIPTRQYQGGVLTPMRRTK